MPSVTPMWQPGWSKDDDARVEPLWQGHDEADDWHLADDDDDAQLDCLSAARRTKPSRTRQRTRLRFAQRSAVRNAFALRKPRRIRTPSGDERYRRIVVCRPARIRSKGKPKAAPQQSCDKLTPQETRTTTQRAENAQSAVPHASVPSLDAPCVPPPTARSRHRLRGQDQEEALTRRRHMLHTGLDPPLLAAAEDERVEAKQQMVLQDEQYFYDVVNNPTEIRDNRIEEEWPAGAKPVSKKIQYDDLYRAKRIEYKYTAGDDAWTSPFDADVDANGVDDSRRAAPSPHVSFAKRILWQTYQYDWLGNNIQTGDDANGFYDRSLGTISNGTANDGPYQLRGADIDPVDPNSDALNAEYDVTGNLETLFVERSGPCLPTGGSCSQSFIYQWDELGRLTHAKRWDGGTQVTNFGTAGADADLEYKYAAGDQRVLKIATDGEGGSVHAVYIYPSLELRRAEYDADSPGDYTRDGATEVAYLFANGVRLARLVNEPLQSDPDPAEVGGLHVFFELGDHLGSTSVALDKATGELVERATYQAYGGAESDYRPGRWGSFREDYRFTGKEEDVEVGLTYFGKRFYNAALQRWASADPLTVHALGGDANLYAYVSGQALQSTDPLGLDKQTYRPVKEGQDLDFDRNRPSNVPRSKPKPASNGNGNDAKDAGQSGGPDGSPNVKAGGKQGGSEEGKGTMTGQVAEGGDGDGSGGCSGLLCLGDPNGKSRETSWADVVQFFKTIVGGDKPEGDQPGVSDGGCASCTIDKDDQKALTVADGILAAITGPLTKVATKVKQAGQAAADGVADAARGAGKAFSKEKEALVDMAQADKMAGGITPQDMQAYKDLNKSLPDPFPKNRVRGPETHAPRTPASTPGPGQKPHGHVGPVDHIPIKEEP